MSKFSITSIISHPASIPSQNPSQTGRPGSIGTYRNFFRGVMKIKRKKPVLSLEQRRKRQVNNFMGNFKTSNAKEPKHYSKGSLKYPHRWQRPEGTGIDKSEISKATKVENALFEECLNALNSGNKSGRKVEMSSLLSPRRLATINPSINELDTSDMGITISQIGNEIREAKHKVKLLIPDKTTQNYICSTSSQTHRIWPSLDCKELKRSQRLQKVISLPELGVFSSNEIRIGNQEVVECKINIYHKISPLTICITYDTSEEITIKH